VGDAKSVFAHGGRHAFAGVVWLLHAWGGGFADGPGRSRAVPLDGAIITAPPGSCHSVDGLPDPLCTPGDRDGRVTPDNIASTICVAGWSKQVRPPASVTEPIKKERMRAYGRTAPMQSFELDHAIPIALGGATSTANLWPQERQAFMGADAKDQLENHLHDLVCSGRESLSDAQQEIATDWIAAYCKARLSKCASGVRPNSEPGGG
jgi:hypothetical protein